MRVVVGHCPRDQVPLHLTTSSGLPFRQSRVSGYKCILPIRQRRKPFAPANDFGEVSDRKFHALGGWHESSDRKIGDREPFANKPSLPSQRIVEHSRKPGEVLLPARDKGGVGAAATEHTFRHFLLSHHAQ
jgi:hypothetical protein